MSDRERKLVKTGELARYLGMAEANIRKLCKERGMPHAMFGKQLRFDKEMVDQWLREKMLENQVAHGQ